MTEYMITHINPPLVLTNVRPALLTILLYILFYKNAFSGPKTLAAAPFASRLQYEKGEKMTTYEIKKGDCLQYKKGIIQIYFGEWFLLFKNFDFSRKTRNFFRYLYMNPETLSYTKENIMVEKNVKKLKARRQRVTSGFNAGTRDMKLKTAYKRKKRWSAEDNADHRFF